MGGFEIAKTIISAAVVITVLGYLFKDNPVYRFVASFVLGASLALTVVVIWQDTLSPKWWQPLTTAFRNIGTDNSILGLLWVLALIPGAMWYFQFSKKYNWIRRLVIGLFIGVVAGLTFKTQILLVLPQISKSFKSFYVVIDGRLAWAESINNIIFTVTLLTTLSFFFFTFRFDNRAMRASAATGRLMLMVCFGAIFGNTVMTRLAYFLERLYFLVKKFFVELILQQWLGF